MDDLQRQSQIISSQDQRPSLSEDLSRKLSVMNNWLASQNSNNRIRKFRGHPHKHTIDMVNCTLTIIEVLWAMKLGDVKKFNRLQTELQKDLRRSRRIMDADPAPPRHMRKSKGERPQPARD